MTLPTPAAVATSASAPSATWTEVVPGVFQHAKHDRRGWYFNTSVVRLRDGTLAVYSPTARLGDAAHQALGELGTPSLLIAPNYYHWLGIAEWQERYPRATVVAGEPAQTRLRKKMPHPLVSLAAVRDKLPGHMDLIEPPGVKHGEFWIRVRATHPRELVWITCDAWMNAPHTPRGMFGLACRALGVTPGLRIARTWTGLVLADKAAYRDWLLAQLQTSPPTCVLMSHGEPIRGDSIAASLAALARRRLS